jgi:hypothetical protein
MIRILPILPQMARETIVKGQQKALIVMPNSTYVPMPMSIIGRSPALPTE